MECKKTLMNESELNMRKIFIALFTLILVGCAAPPTQDQISSAYYGDKPDDYQEMIKGYIKATLKDPDSAKFTWLNDPKKGWYMWRGKTKYGWVVCVAVNAKNSYGGYTGNKAYYHLLQGNNIIEVVPPIGGSDLQAQDACFK